MASQDEIRSRTEFCAMHLSQGVDVNSLVFLVQAQFDVAKATAYRYVKKAEEQIENEDDAPAAEESTPEARQQSLVKLAEMRVMQALAQGDSKDVTASVKALDILRKHSGYSLQMQKDAVKEVPFAIAHKYSED